MRCAMPTRNLRACARDARYLYIRSDGDVLGLCSQHERASGPAAYLRPRPWEYSCKVDAAAHVHVVRDTSCDSRHGAA